MRRKVGVGCSTMEKVGKQYNIVMLQVTNSVKCNSIKNFSCRFTLFNENVKLCKSGVKKSKELNINSSNIST